MNKLIVILGPTASGKSSLAIKLAKKFNGEIISADSRQIYRGMDIGTAKIKCQMSNVKCQVSGVRCQHIPHHLIDIINPDQEFTVAEYKKRAIRIIKDIQRRGKIPFLVGGTGLYIKAIVDNLKIPKVAPNKALRNKLNKKSSQELIKELKKLDPEAAASLDPANKRRLIRALEVCLATKKPFSKQQIKGKPLFDVLQIGLSLPREKLYKKINQRVDQMIKAGLIDEVKSLGKKYSWDLPSMSGIGYRQIGLYLQGKIDLSTAIELIKRDSRRYARRQMTWFKQDKRIHWLKKKQEIEKLIKEFIQKNKSPKFSQRISAS
jgi:tRNA dimethylallyltransferase